MQKLFRVSKIFKNIKLYIDRSSLQWDVIEKFHDSQEYIEEVISDEDNTSQIYIIPGSEFNDWISSPFIECDNNG